MLDDTGDRLAEGSNPDIGESERRLIQRELFLLEDQKDAAEQRFRAMFENALVGLFRAGVKKRELTDANREAARIFGFDSVEELIYWVNVQSDAFSYFQAIPNPDRLNEGEPHSFSAKTKRRDGSEFWAQFSVRYTGDGQFLEGAVKDITDQVESMDRLRMAKAEAEDANDAKSRFLATMSHEIRTPLNGIIGFAEILQERNDSKSREYSRKILDESDRLMILINQLLDISRLEANKITLESIILDLHEMLDEVEESFRPAIERAGIEYCREMDPRLPRWYIGDPMRLRQVLSNLLSNALKFTREGSITLRLEQAGDYSDGPLLRFSVSDTGIGIPEAKQKTIFTSFEQADSSISRRYGGTGLGISICRELVQLMGGTLKVDSRVGEGSTFHFIIPMVLPPDTVDPVPAYRDGRLSKIDTLTGVPVLIVEDYETNRYIACHHLEKAGCEVYFAENGREGLDFMKSGQRIDLIFMDMHMPVMDGLEATRMLRSGGYDTPIIGMTASAYAEDRMRCLAAGMDDFLTKPIRRAMILAKAVDWVAAAGLTSPSEGSLLNHEISSPVTGSATLRYNDFLNELDGEKDLARELLDGFAEDSLKRFRQSLAALESGDMDSLHREVHSIKGGALNVMADDLAAAAFAAEKVVHEGIKEAEIRLLLKDLEEALSRFNRDWKRIQEKNETSER